MMIAVDQYGGVHKIKGIHPRKELLALLGSTKAIKMYQDTRTGTYHIGYIVNGLWLTLFTPWQKEA